MTKALAAALAIFALNTMKENAMTKIASLTAAFVLFAPIAVAILVQVAQIVA